MATRPLDWQALIQQGNRTFQRDDKQHMVALIGGNPRMELLLSKRGRKLRFVDELSMGNNEVRYLLGQLAY